MWLRSFPTRRSSDLLGLGGRSQARGVVTLVLAGAVVSAVLYAYINAMVLLKPGVFDSYRFWMVGSLAGVQLEHLTKLFIPLIVGTLLALGVARSMNARSEEHTSELQSRGHLVCR